MIEGKDYEIIDGHLRIFEDVKRIERYEFYGKKLVSVEIPDSVTYIGESAFSTNHLSKIKIPSSVICIESGAFQRNNLESVEIPDSVNYIGNYAFADNQLISVKLPKGINNIESYSFKNNKLKSVEIPDSVTSIGEAAFRINQLEEVFLPNSICYIGNSAFRSNHLKSFNIPNSVTYIGHFAFKINEFISVNIPKSVTYIGKEAFSSILNDNDVIYGGVLINGELLRKYGYENIIKLYEIQKVFPLEKINDIPKEIVEVIPATEDAIKGYILNKKVFENLNTFADTSDEYKDFFKMCFALGLFSKPDEEVIRFIRQIKEEKSEDYIHQMWTAVKLSTYKPKFKDLFMKLYNEGKTDYEGQNIIGRLYSSFEKINKYTIKRHEEKISKKNTEIKRLKELGANTTLLEQELDNLKKNKKIIEYEDITYYIKNNAFDIREGNEELKSVVDTLSVHMEQEDFDIIQDIYEESLKVEKTIPLTKDTSDKDFKYHWSKSDNPVNTILGYIVDCCAKLGGAGEDIMRQSMINSDITNLILYDENNNIIGKATAYYNKSKKYILFNNAETKEIGTKGLKSAKQRQKECLETLIRGAIDVVEALKEKGEDINEVRIGMLRNDLEDAITEYGLEISYDLLQAYNWKDYSGDASDIEKGQAIIYKDEEVYNKNKDHI